MILSDNSIKDSQEFYIRSDGTTKTKADLRSIDTIEFEAFLLGVWHYLITSQKLQTDLKDIQSIIDDISYEERNICLTYSNIRIESTNSNTEIVSTKKAHSEIRSRRKHIEKIIDETEEYTTYFSHMEDYYPPEIDWDTDIISVLENNDIWLSRGVFFYLLTQSIQTIHPKRNKNAVERLFLDMLNLTADNSCNIDLSQSHVRDHHDKFRYLRTLCSVDRLDHAAVIASFSDRLYSNYAEVLSGMIKIRKKYFNSDHKNEVLVVALIEFIRNDDSIDDCQEFLVCSDGTALTKDQLCEVEEMEFEPFLLGVWHYVVSQLDSKDSADEHTFDTVFKVICIHNGKEHVIYRSGSIINEQSERFIELFYLK